MAAMTWLCSAVAFTLAEDVGEHGRIHSFFDALWWSTTTITTVGYGDVFPITGVGRVIGAITMFVGISAFAVITAKVAEFLVRTAPVEDTRRQPTEACPFRATTSQAQTVRELLDLLVEGPGLDDPPR